MFEINIGTLDKIHIIKLSERENTKYELRLDILFYNSCNL